MLGVIVREDVLRRRRRSGWRIYMASFWRDDRKRTFALRLNMSGACTLNVELAHLTASQFMETISRNLFILIIVIEELLTQCDSSVCLVSVEMFEGTLNF